MVTENTQSSEWWSLQKWVWFVPSRGKFHVKPVRTCYLWGEILLYHWNFRLAACRGAYQIHVLAVRKRNEKYTFPQILTCYRARNTEWVCFKAMKLFGHGLIYEYDLSTPSWLVHVCVCLHENVCLYENILYACKCVYFCPSVCFVCVCVSVCVFVYLFVCDCAFACVCM